MSRYDMPRLKIIDQGREHWITQDGRAWAKNKTRYQIVSAPDDECYLIPLVSQHRWESAVHADGDGEATKEQATDDESVMQPHVASSLRLLDVVEALESIKPFAASWLQIDGDYRRMEQWRKIRALEKQEWYRKARLRSGRTVGASGAPP
jgi:hypothetical protein